MQYLAAENPLAVALIAAIQSGSVAELKQLLAEHAGVAAMRIRSGTPDNPQARSLLHIVTDWPGHFPDGVATVAMLVDAGADVNAPFEGRHAETPLHWAASCDDVAVLDALLDRGAAIDAPGGVIGGGTPLSDACAFGQWQAAQRLVERGASAGLWEAATLGLLERVEACCANSQTPKAITNAFWCACHGGQRNTAEYLLGQGANLNWIGHDDLTPLEAAERSEAHDLAAWLINRGAKRSREVN